MGDVFISYSSDDRPWVKRLAEALEGQGCSVWWDRRIPTGKNYYKVIEEALDAAGCVVVIWSTKAAESDWVSNEAQEGLRRNILIPIAIDHCVPPLGFRHCQTADLSDWDGDSTDPGFQTVVKDIRTLLASNPEPNVVTVPVQAGRTPRNSDVRFQRRNWRWAAVAGVLAVVVTAGVIWNLRSPKPAESPDVFVSYAASDRTTVQTMGPALKKTGVNAWTEADSHRLNEVLSKPVQDAIRSSRAVIVLWSEQASSSLFVRAEMLAGYRLSKPIALCRLDETPLPAFLATGPGCDLRGAQNAAGLVKTALDDARPADPSAVAAPAQSAPRNIVQRMYQGENQTLEILFRGDIKAAKRVQASLDPVVVSALETFPDDPEVLKLAGYHLKNEYQVRHWADLQNSKYPDDEVLSKSAKLFLRGLSVQPDDASSLNGLGSVLFLQKNLDAAEFWVRQALETAKKNNFQYDAAEKDLKNILLARKTAERSRT